MIRYIEIIRIVALTDEAFEPAADFSSDRFFEHSIGITEIDAAPQDILLHCTPIQARYMESQPLHPSQTLTALPDGNYALTLRVLLTYELVEWILGAGPAVEVISPPELRDRVRAALADALKKYTP